MWLGLAVRRCRLVAIFEVCEILSLCNRSGFWNWFVTDVSPVTRLFPRVGVLCRSRGTDLLHVTRVLNRQKPAA